MTNDESNVGEAQPAPDVKVQPQPAERPERKMPSLSEEEEQKAWRTAQKVIQAMLEENIMFSQRNKVEKLVRIMVENIVTAMIFSDMEEIFNRVHASLEQSMRYAQEFVWDKSFSQVTMEDLDEKVRAHFGADPSSADRMVEEDRKVAAEAAEAENAGDSGPVSDGAEA